MAQAGDFQMINKSEARDALFALYRAGVFHWDILSGVAQAFAVAGMRRLDIVDFFWHIMNVSPPILDDNALTMIDDFTGALLGHCPTDRIIHLHGDPENADELSELVWADAKRWKPPT